MNCPGCDLPFVECECAALTRPNGKPPKKAEPLTALAFIAALEVEARLDAERFNQKHGENLGVAPFLVGKLKAEFSRLWDECERLKVQVAAGERRASGGV